MELAERMEFILRLRASAKALVRAQRTVRKAEDDRRQVVVEARSAGMSHADVARELGTSHGRVAQFERAARGRATED